MRRAGLPFSPSEAHAIAIGMLCGAVADLESQWAAAVYADLDPNDVLAQECRVQLEQVFAAAEEQMHDESFGLQLWLPDEQTSGINVSMALRDWAQGFLYGFGLAGEAVAQQLSEEGQEALRDFYEIGQLDADEGELDEEEQQALTEIEEYMRVAAMLVYEDMHAPAAGEGHELH
jgi:uncharacterized protein YgfB (UPF0149 family)